MKFSTFLLAAAVLHLALTVSIFLAGRNGLFPSTFDAHGIGISFAIDSSSYRIEAMRLAEMLSRGEFKRWATSRPQFHVKVYSLSFATFGRITGPNILSAEPLNLVYYLLVLGLVFALGREVFDRRAGLLAAAAVAVWPSFLLHTTQMLRDPLFIVAMLTLVILLVMWLTREFDFARGLVAGLAGGAACLFLWLIRGDMWEVSLAVVLLGSATFALRLLREKRLIKGNVLGAAVLLGLALLIPKVVPTYRQSEAAPVGSTAPAKAPSWSDIPARLMMLRHKFITRYPKAGSNMDVEVELRSLKDIILYLPRAFAVGMFSPFPQMWFGSGEMVGRAGRLLAGMETLVMYAVMAAAALCLWRRRRKLSAWLLMLIAVVGVTALGYVVVNISTLYRMRYIFWIMLIVLGADAILRLREREPEGATAEGASL